MYGSNQRAYRHSKIERVRVLSNRLARWLRDDILAVAGPEYVIRSELFDFVVAELRARESAYPHRIRPVRNLLENQRDNLLAFVVELDRDLTTVAQE